MSATKPYPPFELASRVFRLETWDDPTRVYEELGAQTKRALVGMLPADWTFEGKRVLDFGCGAGRTLRHFLAEAETAEFWGTDVHGPSIAWLQQHLCPPLHGWRSTGGTPLGLEHGSFDLAWAISVFTHLTDDASAWFLELHRLLKREGLFIATYMGRWNSEIMPGEPWDEDRVGRNVVDHNADWDAGGPAVHMSDWWVREHWGRAFEVVKIVPQIQNMSWAVLRKRDVELTTEDLERPGADPREYAALRHNLRQYEGEMFRARVQSELALRQRVSEVRQEYESSRSWQLTRPLRTGARLARALRGRRSG